MDRLEIVDLRHRDCLTDRFHQMNLPISDYTFANLYLFRNISHYETLTKDCGLFISAYNRQGQNYIMPLNDLRVCGLDMLKGLLNEKQFFFPIPEEWLPFFPPQEFAITWDDGESDYIYLTQNMASFKGKPYSRHRNHLNQFFSSYRPDGRQLSISNMEDGLNILYTWQKDSGLVQDKTDFEQCREALENFSTLALWGTIYYIEGNPAGFIIGEALNTDTFCLYFAKASKNYHGIYEFMFNDTANKLQAQYTYLNLEEDMGNKNLRKTKTSYGPERILKKYHVGLRVGVL